MEAERFLIDLCLAFGTQGLKKRIAEMWKFLREQDTKVTEYDEQLVRRLIEKVIVFDDKIMVRFKSGIEIDVKK